MSPEIVALPATVKLTGSPAVETALSGKSGLPKVLSANAPKLIV